MSISPNSISAGYDLTSLMPRYIVSSLESTHSRFHAPLLFPEHQMRWIYRGYRRNVHGAIEPSESSDEFTNDLSTYSVFLSLIAGVMVGHSMPTVPHSYSDQMPCTDYRILYYYERSLPRS